MNAHGVWQVGGSRISSWLVPLRVKRYKRHRFLQHRWGQCGAALFAFACAAIHLRHNLLYNTKRLAIGKRLEHLNRLIRRRSPADLLSI